MIVVVVLAADDKHLENWPKSKRSTLIKSHLSQQLSSVSRDIDKLFLHV